MARSLDRVLSDSTLDGAFVGLLVADLRTGRTLYSRNADFLFMPASNQKLLTTAAALHWLGPEFRFATGVYGTDSVDTDSVLRGDLVIVGSGDPSFSKTHGVNPDSVFHSWVDSLRAKGLRRIDGSVVADESAFDRNRLGYGWDWHYLSFWYAPEISALSCYDNSVIVQVNPGRSPGAGVDVNVLPRTSYVSVENKCRTAAAACKPGLSIWREPGTNKICLSGSLAVGSGNRSYRMSVSDPALFFAHRLTEVLKSSHFEVRGEPAVCDGACPRKILFLSHQSANLESLVGVTNRMSANLSAEMLLKRMGAEVFDGGTFEDGSRAVKAYISAIGMDSSKLHSVDGSGLSRRNLVSPSILVELLRANWESDSVRGLFASLPVAGSLGTLANRMREAPVAGRVRAKTGTLDQTSSLAGYVVTARGRPIAFALMSNHFVEDLDKIRALEEEIAAVLARYRPRHRRPWERR
jgi:D-alanyl-D-alanine carboxypeptidase/D-alanyl-D-alanine-endopeptidase (penicillin-binding protein 4)